MLTQCEEEILGVLTLLKNSSIEYGKALAENEDAVCTIKASRKKALKRIRHILEVERVRKRKRNQYKHEAHKKIDCLWKSGAISRKELYNKISQFLGRCFHFSTATKEECQLVMMTDWLEYKLTKRPSKNIIN